MSHKLQISRLFLHGVPCIQSNIEYGFTLKRKRNMIRTYSQLHSTDKYLQVSSIIWLVLPKSLVFVGELSGCRFDSHCSNLNLRYRAFFEQKGP